MTAHQSVLLQESLEGLAVKADGIYVDGTFGRGGHSQAILQKLGPNGRLIAFDKDLAAVAYAQKHFKNDSRFTIFHEAFTQVKAVAEQLGIVQKINGILLDLGVSSPQLDDADRGFSFTHNGPLDMRMDTTQPLTASAFVNQSSAREMAEVFKRYGEERFAVRIANAIVKARQIAPIETTHAFANIVKTAHPKWEKHKHPATRVFQAIRIHINQELTELETCLERAFNALTVGGRLVVISFHSLEDRIVKQFMRRKETGEQPPQHVPIKAVDIPKTFRRIGKAIKPTEYEVKHNIRARSAVLRTGEKLA